MNYKIFEREDHNLSRKDIEASALKVLKRLYFSGHTAYLVGGGVRDILLGKKPKDFDIVTSARPAEVSRIFRNARLIGRRFRLAHVIYGRSFLEVATFRRTPLLDEFKDELLVRDDNYFGDPYTDALRRDFTVNALFYDIGDFSIHDYVGGIEDLNNGIVRVIGDPAVRFQEDPVRMLRALKLVARFGFTMEPKTEEAVRAFAGHLQFASQARLFEEWIKLLGSTYPDKIFELLAEYQMLEYLDPHFGGILNKAKTGKQHLGFMQQLWGSQCSEGHVLTERSELFSLWTLGCIAKDIQDFLTMTERTFKKRLNDAMKNIGLSRKEADQSMILLRALYSITRQLVEGKVKLKSWRGKSYGNSLAKLTSLLTQHHDEYPLIPEELNATLTEGKGRFECSGNRSRGPSEKKGGSPPKRGKRTFRRRKSR